MSKAEDYATLQEVLEEYRIAVRALDAYGAHFARHWASMTEADRALWQTCRNALEITPSAMMAADELPLKQEDADSYSDPGSPLDINEWRHEIAAGSPQPRSSTSAQWPAQRMEAAPRTPVASTSRIPLRVVKQEPLENTYTFSRSWTSGETAHPVAPQSPLLLATQRATQRRNEKSARREEKRARREEKRARREEKRARQAAAAGEAETARPTVRPNPARSVTLQRSRAPSPPISLHAPGTLQTPDFDEPARPYFQDDAVYWEAHAGADGGTLYEPYTYAPYTYIPYTYEPYTYNIEVHRYEDLYEGFEEQPVAGPSRRIPTPVPDPLPVERASRKRARNSAEDDAGGVDDADRRPRVRVKTEPVYEGVIASGSQDRSGVVGVAGVTAGPSTTQGTEAVPRGSPAHQEAPAPVPKVRRRKKAAVNAPAPVRRSERIRTKEPKK